MHNLFGALEIMDEFKLNNERFISFLPLSHSYERMAGLYFPILINAQIYFCSSTDKLLNEIKETNLQYYQLCLDYMKIFSKKLNYKLLKQTL